MKPPFIFCFALFLFTGASAQISLIDKDSTYEKMTLGKAPDYQLLNYSLQAQEGVIFLFMKPKDYSLKGQYNLTSPKINVLYGIVNTFFWQVNLQDTGSLIRELTNAFGPPNRFWGYVEFLGQHLRFFMDLTEGKSTLHVWRLNKIQQPLKDEMVSPLIGLSFNDPAITALVKKLGDNFTRRDYPGGDADISWYSEGINMGLRNNKLSSFWIYFEKENGFKPVSGKIELPFGLPKEINLAQFLAMFRDEKDELHAKEYMDLPHFKLHLKDEGKGFGSAISYLYIR